jgi:hypothetical protein
MCHGLNTHKPKTQNKTKTKKGTRIGAWIARRAGGAPSMQLRGARPFAHSRVLAAAQVRR